ncbi:hypothetical protein ACFORG_14975 [Lutimaribacter marinistellae]|uniref:Uncharacterized protein n=1 Tax=Lutimaribacter marinistellae TaxID=1820329 RepID=A0ABV7TKR0_9RHOB
MNGFETPLSHKARMDHLRWQAVFRVAELLRQGVVGSRREAFEVVNEEFAEMVTANPGAFTDNRGRGKLVDKALTGSLWGNKHLERGCIEFDRRRAFSVELFGLDRNNDLGAGLDDAREGGNRSSVLVAEWSKRRCKNPKRNP